MSDADTMLNYFAPGAKVPEPIKVFTKPGGPYFAKAKSSSGKPVCVTRKSP